MKNLTFFIIALMFSGVSLAQTKVATDDFARRPQFYQGQTILLSNVSIATGSAVIQNETKQNKPQSTRTRQDEKNCNSYIVYLAPPRCKVKQGWNLINPQIKGMNNPLCFAVLSKIYERLPQNQTFNADIVVEVDVRGISQINRIKVL
jgi:hypothetical protein